jgi:predicted GNAT superfamily acetyltransferase
MPTVTTAPLKLRFRNIDTLEQMTAVEELQKEIWGFSDREIIPAVHIRAVIEVGGVLLGAYDGDSLVGFAYGFLGFEDGQVVMHSDMLGVKTGYRDRGIGYELKLRQRERALQLGIPKITWTFDPLLSRNAYFNLTKLGLWVEEYRVDFYGEAAWSTGLSDTTDRLWAAWPLSSERVLKRLEGGGGWKAGRLLPHPANCLVECAADLTPRRGQRVDAFRGSHVLIEIPAETRVLQSDRQLLAAWRDATRGEFRGAFARNYAVVDYCLIERTGESVGVYVLRPKQPGEAP